MFFELNSLVLITFLLLLVAFASFAIGIGIYRHDKTKKSTRYFGVVTFTAGFWVLGRALLQLSSVTGLAQFWGYFIFIPPTIMVLFLFLFAFYIGQENRKLTFIQKILIFLPWSFLFIFTLFPNTTSQEVVSEASQNIVIYGPLFFKVYFPLIFLYSFGILPVLIHKYFRVGKDLRIRLRYIIFGTGLSIFTAIGANLFLPFFGIINLVWLGPLVAIVLEMIVGYAIIRREFWDIKLLITETVVVVVLLTLLVDIFISTDDDTDRMAFKLIAFILTSLFSYFLIRGIFREVEIREDVHILTEELKRANIRLKEVDNEKSMFVSIASHQLRTPLTIIKGYASMLLEGSFGAINNPEIKKILHNILDASGRLVGMIEDFLNISSIEQGKMSYKFTQIELAELLRNVLDELKTASPKTERRLHFQTDKERQFKIIGDVSKIRQVINNLIDNALKYSPENSFIELSVKKHNKKILLSIKDNGIGISKETVGKLFQKYSRAETTKKLRTEGRGLGLYVAKQIINAHGGAIWVESGGEGKGSVFYLEFNEFIPTQEIDTKRIIQNVKTN